MTLKELYTKLGLKQSFFSQIINGQKRPGLRTAKELEARTGIPIQVWLYGSVEDIKCYLEMSYGEINWFKGW